MFKPKTRRHQERRSGIIRTALILAAIVLFIYLFFIGRTVLSFLA